MSSITFMIPALNEEARIGHTLETVAKVMATRPDLRAQILVIDDGSSDGTARIVTEYARHDGAVALVRHEQNRGLGQALRTALQHADGDNFLIVPGDNDMPAATLLALLARVGDADMIMCYFPDRQERGPARKLLSGLFGAAYAFAFGVRVQYINGPCIYPLIRLRALELFSSRFSIVAEINVKLLRQGSSFLEVPSHRQTGLEGSTSFSWRNLREAVGVYLRLIYEIHWKYRSRYRTPPRRVSLPPAS
jgi:glycosyltransferase involved in cell wall biosynthesis